MIQRIATITLPATEPRHWEGGDVAGKTFDIRSVHHDLDGGYVWVLYEGHYFRGLAYLDLGEYKISSRKVVRDYQGMRGALMDRKPAGAPLAPFMDLLVTSTGVAAILRREGMPHLATELENVVGAVLEGIDWLDEPRGDIDLDLSAMDDFTIYDDSPSERA
jgi:hypothetical protein